MWLFSSRNDSVRLCHTITMSLILYFCSVSHPSCLPIIFSSSAPSVSNWFHPPLPTSFLSFLLPNSLLVPCFIFLLHDLFPLSGEQAAAASGEGAFLGFSQRGNSDCGRWSFLQRCEELLWGKIIFISSLLFSPFRKTKTCLQVRGGSRCSPENTGGRVWRIETLFSLGMCQFKISVLRLLWATYRDKRYYQDNRQTFLK